MTVTFDIQKSRPSKDNKNGVVIWEGASQIDGKPIVAIATGLVRPSTNEKTGGMIQIAIIRADIKPMEAIHTGEDSSVCGDCKCRGTYKTDVPGVSKNVGRICYVNVSNSVRGIFECYARGGYKKPSVGELSKLLAGYEIRFGSYGDPFAVPLSVWKPILDASAKHTGYTHQWQKPAARPYADYFMASVDTPGEKITANILGWRTFRVLTTLEHPGQGEIPCPATQEPKPGKRRVQCIDCVLCSGNQISAKSITVQVHGISPKVKAFEKLRMKMDMEGRCR
jgi:hypothetical protein